jgi:lysophospholipase L1-like esterase
VRNFKTLLINFLVFFLIILISEISLRLLTNSNTVFNINIGGFKEFHPNRGVKLKPNYTGKGTAKDGFNAMATNSFSILGPEFNIKADNKDIRVLAIGNSVTFSPPERNYPLVLEEKLKTKFNYDNIQVICGAVPGYDSYDALDWYDEFLYKLKPDISIIYLGWNDLAQYHPFGVKYKTEKLSYSNKTFIGSLIEYFYILRVPYFFIGRLERSKPVDNSQLTEPENDILENYFPNHYMNNLNELINKIKKNGSSVYVISLAGMMTHENTTEAEKQIMRFPRGMGRKYELYKACYMKYQQALDSVVKTNNVKMIDLSKLIKTPSDRTIFTDDVHINENGSEVFGSYISESISNEISLILNQKINNL